MKISSVNAVRHAHKNGLTAEVRSCLRATPSCSPTPYFMSAQNPLNETRMMRAASTAGSSAGGRHHAGSRAVTRLLDEFVHDNCHWAVLELADQVLPAATACS